MSAHFTRLASFAIVVALLGTGAVQAQDRHMRRAKASAPNRAVLLAEIKAPPLTVKKRSFLDPGNVVPQGYSTPEYIAANTTENQPIYNSYSPARFGESTLPGRFDLPGNPRYFPQQDLDFSPF